MTTASATSSRRLTEAGIQKIKAPASGRLAIADAIVPGLWLRITANDTRSWSVMYRAAGRRSPQRVTIGRWPAIGVAEARQRARDMLLAVERGEDPAADKREQRENADSRFETVAAEFVERVLKPRQRRWQATEALLENKMIKRWQGRAIDTIRKSDVLKVLDREMDAGHYRVANQTWQLAGRLFRWAHERDYIKTDPTTGIARPAKERARDRVLGDDEVLAVYRAAEELGWPFGHFTQLLILLAQRRGEVAKARWQDIDFEKGIWRIPAELTKSQREHEVPLPPEAVQILESLPRVDGSDLVFPATRERLKDGSQRSISGFSKAKVKLDKLSSVNDWTFHDLRRSAASGMARHGVPPHVLAAVLNHDQRSVQGVTAVYNRTRYSKEKREALTLWNQHVVALVAGEDEKVVSIRI
jgi:integrase